MYVNTTNLLPITAKHEIIANICTVYKEDELRVAYILAIPSSKSINGSQK